MFYAVNDLCFIYLCSMRQRGLSKNEPGRSKEGAFDEHSPKLPDAPR